MIPVGTPVRLRDPEQWMQPWRDMAYDQRTACVAEISGGGTTIRLDFPKPLWVTPGDVVVAEVV